MKVLICGGRSFKENTDIARFKRIMNHYIWWETVTEVIHGGAAGADALADMWAKESDITVKVYPAQWDKYGRSAGPVRNQQMLDEGKPDLVIAFPGGAGTANMIKLARRAGVDVLVVAA